LLDKASKAHALKPAVGYLRRSTDRQEQSLGDQQAVIERYARDHGYEVVRFYTDDAISGTSADNRPDFQKLIADAGNGRCDFRFVLCYDVKRFSRGDNDDAGYYRHVLRKRGIEVVYASENFAGDDSDDLVRPVKQWQARQESKDLSKVTIRGQLSSIESGSYMGGVPPYGYDYLYLDSGGKPVQRVRFNERGEKEIYSRDGRTLVRVVPAGERLTSSKQDRLQLVPSTPDRVAVIKRIFEDYLAGHGYRSITHRLNTEVVPSPRSTEHPGGYKGTWGLSSIRCIIMNQVYAGDIVWNRRTQGKFHKVTKRGAVERPRQLAGESKPNPQEEWVVQRNTHDPLVPRHVFDAVQQARLLRDAASYQPKQLRGRGRYSNYLLTGIIECDDCGHKFHGYTHKSRACTKDPSLPRPRYYLCGGYITKGRSVCKRVAYPIKPLEEYILNRLKERLMVFLKDGGEKILRSYIADELAATGIDPKKELEDIQSELARLKGDADRLLDNLTAANRDFVDERLTAIRLRTRELEAKQYELEAVAEGPLDLEAATTQALAQIERFREVLDQGTIIQQKEFLRGMIAGITIHPGKHRGVVTYYDLLPASF
jgi:DNA invertase Pin-like site-specific DNA recombinase/phage host-nuclease inhibitor protein Gam